MLVVCRLFLGRKERKATGGRARIAKRDWRTFGTDHGKWFTVGYARNYEAIRGNGGGRLGGRRAPLRSRFSLLSLTLSVSLFCFPHPPTAPPAAPPSPSRPRVAVAVASKLGQSLVAVASRFGDSKEGSFLFLLISFFPRPPPRLRPNSFHVSFPFASSPLSFSITLPRHLLFPFPFFRSRGAVFSRVRTRTQISALAEPRIVTRRGATSGFCFWIFVLCSAESFQVIRTTSFLSAKRLTARPEEIWSVEDFRGRNRRIETANFTRLPAKRFPRTPRLVPVV